MTNEAISTLHWMLSTDKGVHEVQVNGEIEYIPVSERRYFLRVLQGVASQGSLGYVSLAPRNMPDRHAAAPHCEVLWVEVESGPSAELLASFKPEPTLILRHGNTVRRTALWATSRPLTETWTVQAVKRIAHALSAPKKYARIEHVIPTPGSIVGPNKKVSVELLTANLYAPDEVVGKRRPDRRPLKDAPVSKWRERQAAA